MHISVKNLFLSFALLLAALLVPISRAQETAHATAALRGRVTDPSGALVSHATVTILNGEGLTVKSLATDATGNYQATGLTPGAYSVLIASPGFATYSSSALTLTAGQSKRLEATLAIEGEQQVVRVSEDGGAQISVEADNNASAMVIKGKDLDALSDDPDTLADELSALAGPSAGPNGGQIYIDGFTGGQLPPKSAIREIRINQNPFSAEFDKLGYGRIEVFTKPGSDKLRGRAYVAGNMKQFNTGSPFVANIPDYYSYSVNGSLSGPITHNSSFYFSVDTRNMHNAYLYSAQTGPQATDITSGASINPHSRINFSPRIDVQLGARNTLIARYQFYRDNQSGYLATTRSLPSQATATESFEHQIQISDTQVINDHAVNETRFQFMHGSTDSSSVSGAPTSQVSGYFIGGGSAMQATNLRTNSFEVQNLTTLSLRAHALKFGTRLRYNSESYSSTQNFNGTFNFASIDAYTKATPNKLTYSYPNGASTVVSTAPTFNPNLFDGALFVQDDWKVNRFLTLSGGLRWEAQNKVDRWNDWAPRVAMAYALDGHQSGQKTKTVLRAGYGFFYDRFSLSNDLSALKYSGGEEALRQIVISNPTCYNADSLSVAIGGDPSNPKCGSTSSSNESIVRIAPDYKSPVTEQFGLSLERQITKSTTASFSYLHSYGVHQLVQINANAIDPLTGLRPYGSRLIYEELPEAVFKQNQYIFSLNARFSPRFSVIGNYTLNYADTNGAGGTASNSRNLDQDYGRASFAPRQMLMLIGNIKGPWGITFNPLLSAQSGKPFNITLNNDLSGDNFFNNRPAWANSALCSSDKTGRYIATSYGCFDVNPGAGYTPIPVNLGNGPAAVVVNLRMGRTFSFGVKPNAAKDPSQQREGEGGPPPPPPSGGDRGPGGPGGPGGVFGSAPPRGARDHGDGRYNLTFSLDANNLFNNVNYATPSGVIAPTQDAAGNWGPGDQFGRSSSLAGSIFGGSNSAVRRIMLQMAFTF